MSEPFYFPSARAITCGDTFYYYDVETLSERQTALGQIPRTLDFHFANWHLVKDPAGVRRSIERILEWDFDRFIAIHGNPGNMLERGAKADMAKLLAWFHIHSRRYFHTGFPTSPSAVAVPFCTPMPSQADGQGAPFAPATTLFAIS
jgi:hypothetical protein